ncbi:MAG: hypothetical protein FWG50_02990 [Kiritimatiellaeota bacterium]|nr:hypothetical protein [Kiritimatiellota bacterium]
MLTLILNGVFGVLVAVVFTATKASHWGWSILWGLLVFVAGQGLAAWLLSRRIKNDMTAVQVIMTEGQKRMQQKVHMWQMRPPGSLKQAQTEIERDQKRIVEQALAASARLERYNRWMFLMHRQIATLRIQLYWSVKDFRRVDELLPSALYVEPMMATLKIARMHMLNAPTADIEKFFRKQAAKTRYGQGALLYSLFAWILVQRNDPGEANKVLLEASKKMESDVVKSNLAALANNRLNQFTNAALGEEWYALHLEQPKVKTQRQSPFAKRHY